MKTNIITLPSKTYINEIYPFNAYGIPSNSIIHKEITGCGITTLEIRFTKRNSIVILPNVPVIQAKVKHHNKSFAGREILGVHKGIDVDDIRAYLLNDSIEYKKILTTPEGFVSKILKAFKDDLDNLYNNYFLLYDECERIITDVSYRGNIAAPLDVFFEFTDKALVSATTLEFSDKRFINFDKYNIVPDYDYSQPLTIISTNNVLESINKHITQINSDHVCIFFNSTKGIRLIAERLKMESESRAFCAQESVVKLMEEGYNHASSSFEVRDLHRYNFFTSRYYSAIDIIIEDYKPDIIIISDVFFAAHSIIDPQTEAIQIAGRFRNGVNSLTHITNFNSNLDVKSPQEALTYLNGCLDTYEHVLELFHKADNKGSRSALEFFIKESPLAGFFNNGQRNTFMIDNDLNEERVKNYYTSKDNLATAYDNVKLHFETKMFEEEYAIGDGDMRTLNQMETKLERNKHIAHLLQRYTAKPGSYMYLLLDESVQIKNILTSKYPVIAEAVQLTGTDYIDKIDYSLESLRKIIRDAKKANQIIALATVIHSAFKEFTAYPESDILKKLTKIYEEHKITDKTYATHILKYFAGKRSTIDKANVYVLEAKLLLKPIHKDC